MSRVINTNNDQVSPGFFEQGDFAVTAGGPDITRIVTSAETAPDLMRLCKDDKAYSGAKLERLTRRFGLPVNYLGEPDVDAVSCLDRAAEFVSDHKYVSAKRVLEIGLNDAVAKAPVEERFLKDLSDILNVFIQINYDMLNANKPVSAYDVYPADAWNMGSGMSFESLQTQRALKAYSWESQLEELQRRLTGYTSGIVLFGYLSVAASALALAIGDVVNRNLEICKDWV